jgi:hypothetical protein
MVLAMSNAELLDYQNDVYMQGKLAESNSLLQELRPQSLLSCVPCGRGPGGRPGDR